MAATSAQITTVLASCACANFTLQIDYPTSSLPISRPLCLCNNCRRVTGSCSTSYVSVPSSTKVDPEISGLISYEMSPEPQTTWYFCSKCGAHVLYRVIETGEWRVASGLLDRTEGIVNWDSHEQIQDTLDGGLSNFLTHLIHDNGGKRELKFWLKKKDDNEIAPRGWKLLEKQTEATSIRDTKKDDRLRAQCFCGGVQFYVTRPNEASKKVRSPWSDLFIPYHIGASSANPENVTWWLCANDTKYCAGTCACTSCRLSSGPEIQPWAFIPKCNLFQMDGMPLDYSMGTLKRYNSSKDIFREFCGICGATVFWHCKQRTDLIDVSVGLFDPKEGARVEGWLEWYTQRVSFEEMAVSKRLVRGLSEGLKAWSAKSKDT